MPWERVEDATWCRSCQGERGSLGESARRHDLRRSQVGPPAAWRGLQACALLAALAAPGGWSAASQRETRFRSPWSLDVEVTREDFFAGLGVKCCNADYGPGTLNTSASIPVESQRVHVFQYLLPLGSAWLSKFSVSTDVFMATRLLQDRRPATPKVHSFKFEPRRRCMAPALPLANS